MSDDAPTVEAAREQAADGAKLLELMIGPCQIADEDHDWHDCERCIAMFDVDSRQEFALRLIRAVIAAVRSDALRGSADTRMTRIPDGRTVPRCPECDCRPNRRQAEAAMADAKAVNDSNADLIRELREVRQHLTESQQQREYWETQAVEAESARTESEQQAQAMRETGVPPARILERLKELQKHTHGMAYPEGQTCAVCEEEGEIKDFLSEFALLSTPERTR
jgi:hypothetical protein